MTTRDRTPTRSRTALFAVGAALLVLGACAGSPGQGGEAAMSPQDGARIWGASCNNCHNLRQGTEYSAEEWPVLVKHMRTRAGLTRSQAEAVTAFLQQVAERAAEGS